MTTIKEFQLYVRPVRIVDGDSFIGDVDLGLGIWSHGESIRLYGVDTPERGEPGYMEARNFSAQWLFGSGRPKEFLLKTRGDALGERGRDRAGRILSIVLPPDHSESLNLALWNAKLLKPISPWNRDITDLLA